MHTDTEPAWGRGLMPLAVLSCLEENTINDDKVILK